MDLSPWNYWQDDRSPREGTHDAVRAVEAVLARDASHPGANHFLIHLYERFEPERAEPAADRLVAMAPDAGHLVHMPAHIYWRVGRYQDAARREHRRGGVRRLLPRVVPLAPASTRRPTSRTTSTSSGRRRRPKAGATRRSAPRAASPPSCRATRSRPSRWSRIS